MYQLSYTPPVAPGAQREDPVVVSLSPLDLPYNAVSDNKTKRFRVVHTSTGFVKKKGGLQPRVVRFRGEVQAERMYPQDNGAPSPLYGLLANLQRFYEEDSVIELLMRYDPRNPTVTITGEIDIEGEEVATTDGSRLIVLGRFTITDFNMDLDIVKLYPRRLRYNFTLTQDDVRAEPEPAQPPANTPIVPTI